jgi:IclR family acetate operon transcriptional repressor
MAQGSDRLMGVVESFLTTPRQTLSEAAATCGLSAPTALRYLNDLVERGWLERDEVSRRYTLGVALVTIGGAARAVQPITTRAMPYMKELAAAFDETVNVAMKIQHEVIVVEALEGTQSMRGGAKAGEKDAWFNSSLGKAILAHAPTQEVLDLFARFPPQQRTARSLMTTQAVLADLEQVRRRGYALDDEESEIGLKCVGVPIWGGSELVTYAMSVSGPTQRINNRLDEIATRLLAAAAEISKANKGTR